MCVLVVTGSSIDVHVKEGDTRSVKKTLFQKQLSCLSLPRGFGIAQGSD